ncbi:unnamed protein product [Rotaria sp. Silwood1]|nr:unnamed protein product [Rotaria sp. Silwood1]CAF3891157.1 unnamed protein product [Rotaria sp. Silwood1]CAF4914990.1 unnamed protein product [Rotaria sp. Silwood1]CAF5007580.1 unnamed protein product [Rotaria sp. Silwood1]
MRDSIVSEADPRPIVSLVMRCLPRSFTPSLLEFINLQKLFLHDMEDPWLFVTKPLPISLKHLHLNISLRNKTTVVEELLSVLDRLPQLKYFTIIYQSSYFVIQENSFKLSKVSTTIQSIELNVKCSLLCLEKLLRYLPCVHRLCASVGFIEENAAIYNRHSKFLNVKLLFLSWEFIPIQDIIRFCQTTPNLRRCALNATDYRDDEYVFHPNVWKQFIEEDHVLLERFEVKMTRVATSPQPFGRQMMRNSDPYFSKINFKFYHDYWGNPVLNGDYTKFNE